MPSRPRTPTPKSEPGELLELGYVSGVFGFRGEVRLFLHNPDSDTLDEPRPVVLVGPNGERRKARLRARPGAGKRIIGTFDDVTDEAGARALMNWRLWIDRADLPAKEEGEFFVYELEGLDVFCGEDRIGVVTAVHATDGGDVLEIDGESFVPLVERWVAEVDIDEGFVRLADDALDGADDEEAAEE